MSLLLQEESHTSSAFFFHILLLEELKISVFTPDVNDTGQNVQQVIGIGKAMQVHIARMTVVFQLDIPY
jgi:hypothetical protein